MYIKSNYIYTPILYSWRGKKTSLPHVIIIDILSKRYMEQEDSKQAIVKSMSKFPKAGLQSIGKH